jgi:hypothetical protein
MAQQRLDDADVGAAFQQMSGEAVPPMPRAALAALRRQPDYAAC